MLGLNWDTHIDMLAVAPAMMQGQERETWHQSFPSQVIHVTERFLPGRAKIKPSSGASNPHSLCHRLSFPCAGTGSKRTPLFPSLFEDKTPSAPACFGGCPPTLRAVPCRGLPTPLGAPPADPAWGATRQHSFTASVAKAPPELHLRPHMPTAP